MGVLEARLVPLDGVADSQALQEVQLLLLLGLVLNQWQTIVLVKPWARHLGSGELSGILLDAVVHLDVRHVPLPASNAQL